MTVWTSLEIVKVVVAAFTPLAVLGLGVLVSRGTRRIENRQWVDRKVIERRLDLYDQMAPPLNGIVCFFRAVGNFRELTPPDLVITKRDLDRDFHVAKYLMSHEWGDAYDNLMHACFRTWNGPGTSATIRASLRDQKRERGESWMEVWSTCFVTDDTDEVTKIAVVRARYEALMEAFSHDLGVSDQSDQASDGKKRLESSM